MPSTKEIRRRIKSVKSTRQITRAMEMVAAAKMRKAQMQTLATRAYAKLAWELIQNLAKSVDPRLHKLLQKTSSKNRAAIVLMTSNRGLIGGFNNHIAETAVAVAREYSASDYITLGKKGRDYVRKLGYTIAADFEKKDTSGSVLDIQAVADMVIKDFLIGKYDRVVLVYMDFVSTLIQKPRVLELLPLGDLSRSSTTLPRPGEGLGERSNLEYLFEPTPDYVLEHVLPRLTTMQIYQALLETNAAEHSARMVAMKNASDAAGDIISDLTLQYNQLRQANITKEISEIVAGKLALT